MLFIMSNNLRTNLSSKSSCDEENSFAFLFDIKRKHLKSQHIVKTLKDRKVSKQIPFNPQAFEKLICTCHLVVGFVSSRLSSSSLLSKSRLAGLSFFVSLPLVLTVSEALEDKLSSIPALFIFIISLRCVS